MKKPENTTIEPEVITELRNRVAKANALAAEYNVADNINHSPAAFMSAVLREYDNVVNLYTSHSYLHRVVNDIATALGYRMGDTFEPEALVKKVEHLLGDMYELQLRDEVQHRAIYRIATLMGYNTDDVIDLNELVEKVKQFVAEQDMVISACRGTQMDAAGIRAVKELTNRTVKTESILAALRKPSDVMLNAMSVAAAKANVWVSTAPITSQELQNRLWIAGMNAAIAVAEKEVNL